MQFILFNKPIFFEEIPYQKIQLTQESSLTVKRFDCMHPLVNGNKWFKLKYNLEEMQRRGKDTLVTFGGAYSNHIHATAAAAAHFGIKAVGIIRGEEPRTYSPTLQFAKDQGMQLHFMSRTDYSERYSEEMKMWVHQQWSNAYLVPEGGANYLGVNGAMEMVSDEDLVNFNTFLVAAGTGTTAAGILLKTKPHHRVEVYAALKGVAYMEHEIKKALTYFLSDEDAAQELLDRCEIFDDSLFGGYGKFNQTLIDFIKEQQTNFNLPLDVVYTGKLAYQYFQQKEKPNEGSVLMIHTGGLQGNPAIIRD